MKTTDIVQSITLAIEEENFPKKLQGFLNDIKKFEKADRWSDDFDKFLKDVDQFITLHKTHKSCAMQLISLTLKKRALDTLKEKLIADRNNKQDLQEFYSCLKKKEKELTVKEIFLVASMCKAGKLVKKDEEKAIVWYKKGIVRLHVNCMLSLAALYIDRKQEKESKETIDLIQIAMQNIPKRLHSVVMDENTYRLGWAHKLYGFCLRDGFGIDKNLSDALISFKEADKHYSLASEYGYIDNSLSMNQHIEHCQTLIAEAAKESILVAKSVTASGGTSKKATSENKKNQILWADDGGEITEEDYQEFLKIALNFPSIQKEEEPKTATAVPQKSLLQTPVNIWKQRLEMRDKKNSTSTQNTVAVPTDTAVPTSVIVTTVVQTKGSDDGWQQPRSRKKTFWSDAVPQNQQSQQFNYLPTDFPKLA